MKTLVIMYQTDFSSDKPNYQFCLVDENGAHSKYEVDPYERLNLVFNRSFGGKIGLIDFVNNEKIDEVMILKGGINRIYSPDIFHLHSADDCDCGEVWVKQTFKDGTFDLFLYPACWYLTRIIEDIENKCLSFATREDLEFARFKLTYADFEYEAAYDAAYWDSMQNKLEMRYGCDFKDITGDETIFKQ